MPKSRGQRKDRASKFGDEDDYQDYLDLSAGRSRRKHRSSHKRVESDEDVVAGEKKVLPPVSLVTTSSHAEDNPVAKVIEVIADVSSERLDSWLSQRLSITRSRVTRASKAGCILVDGLPCKPSQKLKPGQVISFSEPVRPPLRVAPEDLQISERILYEDEHLIVLNKPAGMAVHPAGGLVSGTLINGLLHYFGHEAIELAVPESDDVEENDALADSDGDAEIADPSQGATSSSSSAGLTSGTAKELRNGIVRPGIVHRLDRFTSGVMVVAKEQSVHAHLHAQFAAKTTERLYQALVCASSNSVKSNGTISGKIARDAVDRLRMATVPDSERRGKSAVTHFKCIEAFDVGNVILLELRLETGRTHQIRVHCSAGLGAPLLGDDVYGGADSGGTGAGSVAKLSAAAKRVPLEVRACMMRQALHAKTLGFEHPITKQRMHFEAPHPPDFQDVLGILRRIGQRS